MRIAAFSLLLAFAPDCAGGPAEEFINAARAQIGVTIQYDGAYVPLTYPGGDLPLDRGVCTDVVIRAFRRTQLDLQKVVHEDMAAAFHSYPKIWGLRTPDRNIDHRRVPNLMRFFARRGKSVAVTREAGDYRPGDLVTCLVPPALPHIMIVSDRFSANDPRRRLIIHNIGKGAQEEDRLFEFPLTGHYRWW